MFLKAARRALSPSVLRGSVRHFTQTRVALSNLLTETNLHNPTIRNNKHRSDAIDKVFEVEPIVVDGDLAVCEGGGGALGHPVEYITLKPSGSKLAGICKYCNLRYVSSGH
ncbi:hypothetical protein TrCOL_g4065 [Triparma columacea]|uniref:Zinc finger CHCC-type domain-containing protein n=1 Tax=Triparma columacea TaxID=722753 RepID=A0A9W7LC78_9STRA|nr:hypothetical protein TrCOL_g4065 [Triparma columacea]